MAAKGLGPLSVMVAGDRQTVGRYTNKTRRQSRLHAGGVRKHRSALLGQHADREWVHGLYMADYGRQPMADVFVMDLALRDRYTSVERRLTVEPYLLLRIFSTDATPMFRTIPMPGFNVLAGLKVGI